MRILAGSMAIAALAGASPGLAQPRVRLAVDGSVFHSDNPFLLAGGNRGSAAVEAGIEPGIDWQVGHATSLDVSGTLRMRRYERQYGEFVTGGVDAHIRHRDSERLTLRGTLGYSRALPTDALTGGLDAAVDTRTVRETLSAGAFADWSPGPVTRIDAALGATRTRYPGSALLQPINAYDFSITLLRRMSARTTAGLAGQMTISDSPATGTLSAKAVRLTLTQRLSETWRADAQAGLEWGGVPDIPGIPGGGRIPSPRFTGTGSLCNETVRFMLCLSAALRSQASALTGLQRELTVGGNAEIRLSERGRLSLTADYRQARGAAVPLDLLRASAGYEHRLGQRLSLSGGVDYLRRTQADSGRVGAAIFHVTLTFRGPRR
ncbi:MAG: hypothetical protein QM690_14765 [Sphingobium sp.]